MYLSQYEANLLIGMEKVFASQEQLVLGNLLINVTRELTSLDKRELFLLDIWRSGLNLSKIKMQNRAREVNILVRVDFGGSLHRNPDGNTIQCPHIHLYREGYHDKWAYPLSDFSDFRNSENITELLEDFSRYCNIIKLPSIQYSYV